MKQVFPINRGSDCPFSGVLSDDLGVPINLTGYTISAFEPSAELAPYLTLAITNAAAGVFTGRIEWNDGFPNGMQMRFKIKFSIGINDTTSPSIWINVQ